MDLIAYFNWNVSPEIFRIGPVAIRWYGLLFALGFILGYNIMTQFFNKEKRPLKDLESLTITMIVGTIIGARLGHCFFYDPSYYLADPVRNFNRFVVLCQKTSEIHYALGARPCSDCCCSRRFSYSAR